MVGAAGGACPGHCPKIIQADSLSSSFSFSDIVTAEERRNRGSNRKHTDSLLSGIMAAEGSKNGLDITKGSILRQKMSRLQEAAPEVNVYVMSARKGSLGK